MNRPRLPVRRDELASLEERLGLLLPMRAGLAVVMGALATFAPSHLATSAGQARAIAAAYLAVGLLAELLARVAPATRVPGHRLLVVADVVVLVWVLVPTGAPNVTAALLAVPLVAVTLLASFRGGVRVTLWATVLLLADREPSLAHVLRVWRHPPVIHPANLTGTIVLIVALWAVTVSAGWFESVNERELRRTKVELGALTRMAAAMEPMQQPSEILDGLLDGLGAGFGASEAVAVWEDGTNVEIRRVGEDPAPVQAPDAGWADGVAAAAWEERGAVPVRALDPVADPVLSRLLPGAGRCIVLPLGPDGEHRGVVAIAIGSRLRAERFPARTLAVLGQFSNHATLVLRNARLKAEQEKLARRDGLTGLANRRAFDESIQNEVSRARRSGAPLALVVLDIDHFKAVNDQRGHQAGDELLRRVGAVLGTSVRAGDTAARYGGEEFALILPACSAVSAGRVAEKIRAAIAATPGLFGITLSAGVAALPEHADDGDTLVRLADAAMYRSKRNGRDRVTLFEPGVSGLLDLTELPRS